MRGFSAIGAVAASTWADCFSALEAAEALFRSGERCDERYSVTFDWARYTKRTKGRGAADAERRAVEQYAFGW